LKAIVVGTGHGGQAWAWKKGLFIHVMIEQQTTFYNLNFKA